MKNMGISENNINFGYFHIITVIFCFIFVLSNIAASKVSIIYGVYIDAGTFYFPFLYVLTDITTEIYGFKASRRIMWLAASMNIAFVLMLSLAVKLPAAEGYGRNASFNFLFDLSPRILIASISSFLIGEYLNSVILAITKIRFKGRMFASRAFFSTCIGITVESTLFAIIAFYGRVPTDELYSMTVLLVSAKIVYELLSLPISSRIVRYLKKYENIDYYDRDTKFNLFSF